MQTSSTRHVAAFAAALALALVPATASAVLERVGPNRPDNFLPAWYQDTTGLAMEFCTPQTQAELDGGWCLILPADVPGGLAPEVFPNAFSGEHFYWASDVVGDWQYTIPAGPGQTPITISSGVLLVQAIEAAFLGDIGPGLGQVFGRIRVRVLDLPLTGIYKFYTPWGIKEIAGLAGDRIFDTEDIGINCPPFQYDCALATSIGPFLVPSNTPGGAELPPVAGPSGGFFLSDPARVGPVTGSPVAAPYNLAPVGQYSQTAGVPTNPNVYAIEAPDGQVIFKSHDFATVGRVWNNVIPGRVKSDRASYARDPGGAIQLHAFATGEPTVAPRLPAAPPSVATQPALHLFSAPCTGTVDPTGNLLPPYGAPVGETSVPMSRNGNLYFASTAPAAVPAGVCVMDANARTAQGVVQPTYSLGSVTDQVFVTAAVYDPSNGGSLSVRASSSDQFAPPLLSVGAFGTMTANAPVTDDLAFLAPLAAPPDSVRVHSQEGGTAGLLVKVGSRKATGVTLTADRVSPQVPGTAVVFKAQGAGAAEYLYRFFLDTGSGFGVTPVQDWSNNPYWALSANFGPGRYRVVAEVWAGLQATAPDAVSNIVTFDIREPPATGVELVADRTSPAPFYIEPLPTVFTAAGQGSTSPYSYRFSLSTNGGPFAVVQNYGNGASWTMPASTPIGTHQVRVDVRTSATVDLDATSTVTFQLVQPAPATSLSVSSSVASPSVVGSPVLFTANATGAPSYQFRFTLWSSATGISAVVQNWGTSNTWTMPGSQGEANYILTVDVRTSTAVAKDLSSAVAHTLRTNAAPTGVTISPSASSPHLMVAGSPVVFTAAATGSSNYQYRFWLWSSLTGVTTQVQAYSASNTWTMPDTTAPATYVVTVDVRTSALVAKDLSATTTYVVTAVGPASSVTLSASAPSPHLMQPGAAVTFTAAGQGSSSYQYRFWLWSSATGLTTQVQAYSSTATWTLPDTTAAGTYVVTVDVRTSTQVAKDASAAMSYVISTATPATGVTLTPSLSSPRPFGTTVDFTAAGSGSTGYQYRFWLWSSTTGQTTMVQGYSTNATWTMPPTTTPGNYFVTADVRTSPTVSKDKSAAVAYTVSP